MKNIHILPTDKLTKISISKKTNTIVYNKDKHDTLTMFVNQNIYITSDKEIKEGDWCLDYENEVVKYNENKHNMLFISVCKKIILTTDQDLIKDGVQAIDDEFLEWFVQNPSCEEVAIEEKTIDEIELELNIHGYDQGLSEREFSEWLKDGGQLYRIVILKEEPKFENSIENTINIMSMVNSMFGKKEEPKKDIIKTEEDAKIFVEALENIPEPNDKLKKVFRDFGKQETLEEAAENYSKITLNKGGLMSNKQINGFITGAKWQQEKSYSEEEVIEFVNWLGDNRCLDDTYKANIGWVFFMKNEKGKDFKSTKELLKEWFEQFKKK